MYRIKPQTWAVSHRTRQPAFLVASTVAAVTAASLASRTAYCQHDVELQAQAEDLKDHVQEFTNHILEMEDSPYGIKHPSSSPLDRYRSHGPHSHPYRHHSGPYAEEPLIPALFYITIAGMAGSIIARKSNIVFRFLSPTALAIGAAAYCIPRTTNNVLHGVRTYDYGGLKREWQHTFAHAKQSIMDTTHSLTAAAGFAANEAQDAVHDLSDKSQDLVDKTQKVLKDAKDKTVQVASELKDKTAGVANDLKDKGEDVAKKVKSKSEELEQDLGHVKDQATEQLKDKTDQARQWWNNANVKENMERTAKDIKHGAREAGEQARDWAENAGEDARDWFYNKAEALRSNGPDGEDIERNFERLKSKAQQGWNTARDEAREAAALARHRGYQYRDDISDDLQDRGQDMRRGAEQMKDQFQDWAQDRSHEFHGRFEQMRDRGQDWAQDRRREFQKWGREMEDQADRSGRDFKRRAQDLRDMGEDHFKNARREFRNGAEEWRHHGRHHLRNLERDVDDIGSRHDEHEEIAGRGRRRSVTETAKEGKSWWPQRHYEAEEGRDDMRPASSSTKASWWKAGSTSKDQAMEQFDQAKDHAQRGMGHLKDSLKETAESGRSWVSDKSGDIRDRFEHGKHQAEREFHDKFSRDRNYRHEQGRDYGERPQRASSVNSNDNWFHLDHSVDNRAYAGRGRERGM